MHSTMDPSIISRNKKEEFLQTLSEYDFRDKVLRPIFHRLGYTDGRDLCGPTEEGKDTIFIEYNKLGHRKILAIQTKRANINMSGKPNQNILECITQLRTALDTKIALIHPEKIKALPDNVLLCASGKISTGAKKHIVEEISDTRLSFMDADDIIPLLDKHYSEFWLGIDANKFPYLNRLKEHLVSNSDTISLSEIDAGKTSNAPISNEQYVEMSLYRVASVPQKSHGHIERKPVFDEVTIEGLLSKKERLFRIAGEAGSGKTTVLRRLAYLLCEKALSNIDSAKIPIFIKARDINIESPLIEVLINETSQYTDEKTACFTTDELNEGRLVILIDALDEAASSNYSPILNRVVEFNNTYPQCIIILTSRNYFSINSLPLINLFTKYDISPISLTQAEKLLVRLQKGKSLAETKAKELLRRLHDVHGLDLNPLLITIFIATSDYSRKDIPANITELFKKFTEMMLGRWDMKKGMSQQYHATLKDHLLKELAFEMHKMKKTQYPLYDCKSIFSSTLTQTGHQADLEILFDEIVYRSGLLNIDCDMVSFRHTLLQEFFAGRAIPSLDFFQSVVTDDWWKHPMLFYFGENPAKHSEIIQLIAKVESLAGYDLFRAASAIGLAIQACYLSKVTDKISSMDWVISKLSESQKGFIEKLITQTPKLPTIAFLHYYFCAKDSTACEAIKSHYESSINELINKETRDDSEDGRLFWYIASLIEIGDFDTLINAIKKFKPTDCRYLMAIHIACFIFAHLKTSSKDDKKSALAICSYLNPKIAYLREEVIKEMKTMLLEYKQGDIKALSDDSIDTPE